MEQWSDGTKDEVVMEYFFELFKSSNPSSYAPAFESFNPKVFVEMNETLTWTISKEEVSQAIFSICHDSALGPDGMTVPFSQILGNNRGSSDCRNPRSLSVRGDAQKVESYLFLFTIENLNSRAHV